jgi:hypothetical protein
MVQCGCLPQVLQESLKGLPQGSQHGAEVHVQTNLPLCAMQSSLTFARLLRMLVYGSPQKRHARGGWWWVHQMPALDHPVSNHTIGQTPENDFECSHRALTSCQHL